MPVWLDMPVDTAEDRKREARTLALYFETEGEMTAAAAKKKECHKEAKMKACIADADFEEALAAVAAAAAQNTAIEQRHAANGPVAGGQKAISTDSKDSDGDTFGRFLPDLSAMNLSM